MKDERFDFAMFEDAPAVEELEFPNKLSKAEYLSKVLCVHLSRSTQILEIMQKSTEAASATQNQEVAMVKLLRAMVGLDHEEEHTVSEKITNLQEEFNYAMLEGALGEHRGEHNFYRHVFGFRYDYIENILQKGNRFPLNVYKMGMDGSDEEPMIVDSHKFVNLAHELHDGASLDIYLQERDRNKLGLTDVEDFPAARDLAAKLLEQYSLLRKKGILNSIVDPRELCYTVCAGFAPELIKDKQLKQDMVEVVKGKAPARLKWLTSILYVYTDNVLQVGALAKAATEEGYAK